MSQSVRLGAFLLVTLAILGTFVFFVGSLESRFQSNYRIKADFANVGGLTEGADVRVGGIHCGTVRRIQLPTRPDGKVMVEMSLAKATLDVVKQDSVAAIKSEGLLGDKYVEVGFGTPGAANLKGGETIGSEPPLDISDIVAKTNQLLDGARDALENVDQITAKVNQGKGTVGALINDKTVYRQAAAGATALTEDAEALKHNFLLRGYFKNRGYEDSADLNKYAIAGIPAGPAQKTFAFESKNLFDKSDTAKLRNEKTLNEAGKYLQAEPFGLAVIAASTGMKGDSDKDRRLTQARAFVVRDYLVRNFKLDDERIKIIGRGKEENATDQVEILVFPKTPAAPTGKK